VEELYGDEVPREMETATLTRSDDGKTLEVSLKGEGYPKLAIPAGYPRVRISATGWSHIMLQPESE